MITTLMLMGVITGAILSSFSLLRKPFLWAILALATGLAIAPVTGIPLFFALGFSPACTLGAVLIAISRIP